MSVAAQLDLDDPGRSLLAQARTDWAVWRSRDPRLAVVDDLLDLPGWIRSADREDVDDVLHALARLGSPAGDDDVVAAGALSWLLLPGAIQLARRLRDMTPRIDECVAAQLWIEVRSFAWERRRKVAGNIVMNLRRNVLRELGAVEHVRAVDPAWARAMPLVKWAYSSGTNDPCSRPRKDAVIDSGCATSSSGASGRFGLRDGVLSGASACAWSPRCGRLSASTDGRVGDAVVSVVGLVGRCREDVRHGGESAQGT